MIGASKILTVSYGTFSCTLEGFDDPFNTMRAIAEYFRDLAAEDRYFGAEPPTPDAAMLHRIAEREINRRVEANIQENGVILRAGDVEVNRPATGRAAPAVAAPAVFAPTEFAPTEFAPAEIAPALADPNEDDSVTSRLARLREAQALAEQAAADTNAESDAIPVMDSNDDEDAGSLESAMAQSDVWDAPVADDTIASVMANLGVPDADAAQNVVAEAFDDATRDADALADIETVDELPSDEPQPTEVATWPLVDDVAIATDATLDMAPVGSDDDSIDQLPPQSDTAFDTTQDETAADSAAGHAMHDDASLQATLGAMIDPEEDDMPVVVPVADKPVADTGMFDAQYFETGTPEIDDADALHSDDSPQHDMQDDAPIAATVIEDDAGPAGPHDAQPDIAAAAPDPEVMEDDRPSDAPETDVAPAPQRDTLADERLQRARARVIKIRRIDVGAAPATPASVSDPAPDTAAPDASVSALSPEAEAELQRELSSLEADLAPGADPAADAQTPPKPASADDTVNRLISQTNAAMEGPENKRRLAAIAHLKAAVAATFADRRANATPSQPGPDEQMDPYREDLDRVVRPRRPSLVNPGTQDAAASPARPTLENRPAPLVLVSAQRIDRPATAVPAAAALPVRPRRVTTDLIAADTALDPEHGSSTAQQANDGSEDGMLIEDDVNNIFSDPTQPFAEFAERLGAVTMPDLMEAAAAYCAMQLGREQFTRPLLLQQIADLPTGDAYNREDCLRGFGTLLRDGRILKIKRGQFKLSTQSRYLTEANRKVG